MYDDYEYDDDDDRALWRSGWGGDRPLGELDEWESWDWTDIDLPPGPEYLLYKYNLDHGEGVGGC